MPVRILEDNEINLLITPDLAVESMRNAILSHGKGLLVSPPRVKSQLRDVAIDFTTGELSGKWFGYRSNALSKVGDGEQIVALQDYHSGEVRALALGHTLGPYRTGAIGAVAVDTLAATTAVSLGIIGSGPQAWTQLWAIASVRKLVKVSVYSPNQSRRETFAARAKSELGVNAVALPNAQQAVEGHQIIVLATNSSTPVIKSNWLERNVHINTLGKKSTHSSEFGLDVLDHCSVAFTDSIDQLMVSQKDLIFDSNYLENVVPLSTALSNQNQQMQLAQQATIFFSVGLAGTELFLLDSLLKIKSQ